MSKPKTAAKDVVARRGSCAATGAGLSHYILIRK
jgi:modified peptide precursor CbpA